MFYREFSKGRRVHKVRLLPADNDALHTINREWLPSSTFAKISVLLVGE